jgi:AAA15 family ATPase/GTPase
MKINWIKIENFLSIEKAYVNFDSLGKITRIVGINKDTRPHS